MPLFLLEKIISFFFEYESSVMVVIHNKTLGLINRCIQLGILLYIVGYVLIYKKGYQDSSSVESVTMTKLKGIINTNLTDRNFPSDVWKRIPNTQIYNRIWDVPDAITPQDGGSFFVMTNVIITPNQTQGYCSEEAIHEAVCDSANATKVCIKGEILPRGNGIMTGKCVPDYYGQPNVSTCEIRAWCPVEYDVLPTTPLLMASANFTVFIKNSVEFSLWKEVTRNIPDTAEESFLRNCRYDATTNPHCPIFRLGKIVEEAGEDYRKIAETGGVIGIIIDWDCNLDYNIQHCLPTYSFRRIDKANAKISPGWNFRYTHYFNNGDTRTLFKAYGILFTIYVDGKGGKFNIIPLMRNIGAGLGLLSIAVVICDVVVVHLMKKRLIYKEKKYVLASSEIQSPE